MGSRKRLKHNKGGILATLSNSTVVKKTKKAARDSTYVATRLLKSTGKAAWIAATTFLVIGIPLVIVMEREHQFNEIDLQQQTLLGASASMVPQPR